MAKLRLSHGELVRIDVPSQKSVHLPLVVFQHVADNGITTTSDVAKAFSLDNRKVSKMRVLVASSFASGIDGYIDNLKRRFESASGHAVFVTSMVG